MEKQETRGFQSEVKQLLHLMIHSLYSNKEVFLRELISNASDAVDKLRFQALSKPNLYEDDTDLHIRISYNKNKRTIKLIDNGIGMTREEVIENLGTIAKSGTKDFLKSFKDNQLKDNSFIGQFGVGFYSAFMVANKVTVKTRAAGLKKSDGVFWQSTGEGDYIVANIEKINRGTEIILYLREGEDEFLNEWRIQGIVNKYSDHINLPIEIEVYDKNDNEKSIVPYWKRINKAQALWIRNKSEISQEEYKEFYKHLFHDSNEPLVWSHNLVEGKQEYISLLFIPSKSPWNIWNREYKCGIKLYVQRIFIMDNAENFIPNYLRFIKGLIDSRDLPLNISRETLQNNRISNNLRKALTKRILTMLENMANTDSNKFQLFWNEFGVILKEGIGEDFENSKRIANLLRFASTSTNSAIQNVSLKMYIDRMLEKQDKIYYITSDSYNSARNSPHLELMYKKNIEVLLLSDRIDEWMMGYLTEFSGKTFQLVSKSNLYLDKLNDDKENNKIKNDELIKSLVIRIKTYLKDKIKDVKLTNRLINTPAVLTTDESEMTTQMAKLFANTGQPVPIIKYTFELNPNHKLISMISNVKEEIIFNKWTDLLFWQALLAEKGSLEDPNEFINCMNYLLTLK